MRNMLSTSVFDSSKDLSQVNNVTTNRRCEMRVKEEEEINSNAMKLSGPLRSYLLGGIAAVFIAMGTTVYAQDSTGTAGGRNPFAEPPPSPYEIACGPNEAVVGLTGESGQYVDYLKLKCVQINNQGKWVGDVRTTGFAGRDGNANPYDVTCSRDQVVSGFKGKAGWFVDRLVLECKRLAPIQPGQSRQTTGNPTYLPAIGGNSGDSFGPIPCPNSKPASQVFGKSGRFIDSFGLKCQ